MERKYSLLKRGGKAAAGGVVLGLALLLSVLGFHGGLLPANAVPEEGCELPIIMYHGLLKEEARQGKYVLSPARFESDLKYLKENGYHTVVVQDLIDYVEKGVPLPEKPVMLTFDDGYYNNYYYAFPLLEEYDAKIVISPICRYTDEYSQADDAHPNYSHITWDNINEMIDSGRVEIQNHSYNMHSYDGKRVGAKRMKGESDLDYETAFTQDLTRAQERIRQMTGWTPTCFAYPFGAISDGTQTMLKTMGFQSSMTCESHTNQITRDPECLFGLGRYLRPGLQSTEAFFQKIGL